MDKSLNQLFTFLNTYIYKKLLNPSRNSNHSNPGLFEVVLEAAILERHARGTKVGVLQRRAGRLGQHVPVDHGVVLAGAGLELQLVVGREVGEVLDHRAVALALRVVRLLVVAVAGRGGADEGGGSVGWEGRQLRLGMGRARRLTWVVDPDDDVLPVVAVAAGDVAVVGLVLRPVPRVHDAEAAVVPGGTDVGLALGLVAASAGGAAAVLETAAELG